MFGWHVPAPNEAMLISGGKGTGGAPFRIVTGHGAFAMPMRNRVSYLTLAMQEAEVDEPCVTQQGITLRARAVIAFKVADDPESIANAARRFLADQAAMPELVGRVFAGHLRSIIGSMTVEDIIRERQKLATEVLDASKPEMGKLGLGVDSFQIESIDDGQSGYIAAMSKPHVAAVNQAAQIAEAHAQQAAAEAAQESARNQAAYERETAVARARYQAEIDTAQRSAGQAGPMAQAQAQQSVLTEQAKVAERQAELRRQELVAEVQRPAEAEAERVRILARAKAQAIELEAHATASSDGVILQRMLVEQMPEIVAAVAQQLAGANVTVLDGADGLGKMVAGLVVQANTILTAVRGASPGVGGHQAVTAPDGAARADVVALAGGDPQGTGGGGPATG